MCLDLLLLLLELLLELGVDLLKMYILRLFIVKALPQGSEFLTIVGKGLQFFCLLPGVGDHSLHNKRKARLATPYSHCQKRLSGLTMVKSCAFLKFSAYSMRIPVASPTCRCLGG
jgi:hypothetical protein